MVEVPVSAGELCDRLVILTLKAARIPEPGRSAARRLHDLYAARWAAAGLPADPPEREELSRINAELWDVEDALRRRERAGDFDAGFVRLARSVYRLNDARAAAKASLDRRLGSEGTEPKHHADGAPGGDPARG